MVQISDQITDRAGLMRERILRRILQPSRAGERRRSLYGIAKDADVSYSWAHQILKELESLGATRELRVVKPDIAYGYWLKHRVSPLFRDYQVPEPVATIKKADLPYAMTTYAADQVTQRYLFARRYDVYIRGHDGMAWHRKAVRAGFVGSGNLRLLLYDDDVLKMSVTHQGLRTVSIPQLIIDLVAEGGACVEAARLLFQKTYHADAPIQWT